MGAGRYLESLPVGPNHSDSVLSPGLFLQPPQLPASLFIGGVGGKRRTAGTNEAREDERRKREKSFLPEVSEHHIEYTHRHTHCTRTHCTPAICVHREILYLDSRNKHGTLRVTVRTVMETDLAFAFFFFF